MGKQARNARSKFAVMRNMVQASDPRIRWKQDEKAKAKKNGWITNPELQHKVHLKKKEDNAEPVMKVKRNGPNMFFNYNMSLGPPFHLLMDTNFINFSIQNKMDVVQASMDCLYGKCIPCVTDCVMAELEKLGLKYRLALRMAKDLRFERLPCQHKGTYADDCLVRRVQVSPCYIVGTCDKDLKRRLRRIQGVPIMSIKQRRYHVERLPDALGGDTMKVK